MKCIKPLIVGSLAAIALTGCKYKYQPRVYFYPDHWEMERTEILLPHGTDLNYGHAYDTVQTENGFDMTIHFVTGGGDQK